MERGSYEDGERSYDYGGGDGEVEGGVGGDEGVLDWREESEREARI